MIDEAFSPDLFPSGCLVTTDGSGQDHCEIIYANHYICEVLGYTRQTLEGQPVAAVFSNASNIMIDSYVMPMLLNGERCEEILLELRKTEGDKVPVMLNAVRPNPEDGRIYWSLLRAVQRNQLDQELVRARNELQEKAQQLTELSGTDELTGLLNRRELNRRTDLLLSQCARTGQSVSLLIFDVDNFKTINDSLGHIEGDRILVSLGHLLKEQGRESDIIARYGGDEFLIVMPDTDTDQARILADRLSAQVRELDAGGHSFSVSFGVSSALSADSESLESLFLQADRALYEAKDARRSVMDR